MNPIEKLNGNTSTRLMLGTVQFGLDYGLANKIGKPSYETALDIVACAVEGGIDGLDTAAAYGNSEEILGKIIAELDLTDKVVIVTKVPLVKEELSPRAADEYVEKCVASSLKRLGLDVLPICLFHNEKDFKYFDSLLKMKDKGLIQSVGVSTISPAAVKKIIDCDDVEAVQIPTNLFDRRFSDAGIFQAAKSKGIAVFVRSVYFQGLALMPIGNIIPYLQQMVPIREALDALAHEAGLENTEMAMRYVFGIDGITRVLVGVESIDQMRDNIKLISAAPLPDDLRERIHQVVPELPEHIINPVKWPQEYVFRK